MWIRSLMKYEPAAAIYLLRFDITSQVVRGREGYANRIFLYCSMGAPWERLMFFFPEYEANFRCAEEKPTRRAFFNRPRW